MVTSIAAHLRFAALAAVLAAALLAAAIPHSTLGRTAAPGATASGAEPGGAARGEVASVHGAVRDLRFHGRDGLVSVILQVRDGAAAAAAVEAAGGTVERRFSIIPAIEASVPAGAIDALAASGTLTRISLNAAVEESDAPEWARGRADGPPRRADDDDASDADDDDASLVERLRPDGGADSRDLFGERTPRGRLRGTYGDLVSAFPGAIGATDVWDEGVTGKGVGIAIVDTGVNAGDLADFGDRVIARLTSAPDGQAADLHGHGTHVAGIAAGDGEHSDARFMGIAPDANIISVRVGGYAQGPRLGDAIAGLELVLAHRDDLGIRIANLSFSSAIPESFVVSPLNAAVEQLWFNGIVVVTAVGNRGSADFAVDHPPANDPYAISVGAFADQGTLTAEDDVLATWSSRGLSHDGFARPDVVAPGSRLIATVGTRNALLYLTYPENRVGDYYFRMGGTSAAAPVVAGVAALILEEHPWLTPDQVKARIVERSGALPGSLAPRVDAYAAVFGPDAGLANQGYPVNVWVDRDSGTIRNEPASLDGLTWEGFTWDGLTWEGLTWEGLTWEGFTWDGLTWEGLTWEGLTWDGLTWEGLTWEGLIAEDAPAPTATGGSPGGSAGARGFTWERGRPR